MLELLPGAYIDNSLLTSVLIGVRVLWWLAERFGWPATGLVVPGYLGAVLAVRPEAALVVAGEAVITYLVAHFLGRMLSGAPTFERVFGRDRFFLIILVSIFVRMIAEGDLVREALLGADVELSEAWHSLGLVLVPLTANTLWKPGLLKGTPLVLIPVLAVYGFLVFILIPLTNFNLSEFELTYEDLSWAFVDAPREYVLVLIGAFIASHTTARYGWDFGGIIVCGLLAISWLDPVKLGATLAEILLIVLAMRALVVRWPLRTANMSGLRPIVLAFVLSWLLKYLLAWVSQGLWPGFRIGELFGFGYLLPAIVATRCWRAGSVARVLMPALGISFVTALLGLGLGQGLVELRSGVMQAASADTEPVTDISSKRRVVHMLTPPDDRVDQPLTGEVRTALVAADAGVAWQGRRAKVDLSDEGAVIHSGDLGLIGTAWLRDGAGSLEIQVPRAHIEPGLAEAAVTLAEVLDADLLLLSPSTEMRRRSHDPSRRILILESGETSMLEADGELPDEIDLEPLVELLVDLPTSFDHAGRGDARLTLSELAVLELALRSFDLPTTRATQPLWDEDGYPRTTDNDPRGAEPITNLALLDRGVLQPILLARTGDPRWLRVAADHAAAMGMVLAYDEETIQLAPGPEREPPRFTLWLRTEGSPYAVEVRAAGRHHLAVEVGQAWYDQLEASALLVHDARADLDAAALRNAGSAAPELAVLRDLALGIDELTVLAIEASREDEIPGADAVISLGRPLDLVDEVPDAMWTAAGLAHYAGGSTSWYDGDARRIRFYDPSNPRREIVRAAGGEYVTAYLAPPYRLLYAGLGEGSILSAYLENARIPVGEARLETLLEGEVLDAGEQELLDALHLFDDTRHPAALERFRVDAQELGMRVWAFEDPDLRLVFLVAESDERRLITPVGLPRRAPYIDPRWLPGPALPAWRAP